MEASLAVEIWLIKMLVTPCLVVAVSLVTKHWGSLTGGILAGMPLTSGPILIFITIEQGASYARSSIQESIAGLAAIMIAYLAYLIASKKLNQLTCIAISLTSFIVSSYLLVFTGERLLSISSILFCVALILILTPQTPLKNNNIENKNINLFARVACAVTLVIIVTESAYHFGPKVSGILSPIPAIAWPVLVFTHYQQGRRMLLQMIRGNAVSGIGVLVFYVVSEYNLTRSNIFVTFLIAIGCALSVSILIYVLSSRILIKIKNQKSTPGVDI